MSLRDLLRKLLLRVEPFSPADAAAALDKIMTGAATPAQVGAFLVGLRDLQAEPGLVAALAETMRAHARPLPLRDESETRFVVDIVGTGGDGVGSFNASTAAGIVAAGAGARVAKHGNRSSSSPTGSADFMEALGAKLDLDADKLREAIDQTGFCFVYAQKFHPAMQYVAGPRREIGVPTVFNILGPLSSPARPDALVVGVYDAKLGRLVAETFKLQGVKRAMVVHGKEGLDEISPAGPTLVWHLHDNIIQEFECSPKDFGLQSHALETIEGGSSAENADTMRRLLNGEYSSPIADFVVLNAAALLFVAGIAPTLREAADAARESLRSGRAAQVLATYVLLSQV